MTTLYFKALLAKSGFWIFARALGIYLLITLPTLVFPPMYIVSAGYALSFGWIAGPFFMAIYCVLQKINVGVLTRNMACYAAVVAAVGVAFQMIEVMGAEARIWQSGIFLLFPLAAVISGWISLAISKHSISGRFAHNDVSDCIPVVTTSSNHENIY